MAPAHLLGVRAQCSTSASTRTRVALRAAPTRAFVSLTATPSNRLTGAVRAPAPLPQYPAQLAHVQTLWACAVQTSPMAGSGSWRCSSGATSWHWWAAGATRATRRTRSWCGMTTRTAVSVSSPPRITPHRRASSPPPRMEVAAAARGTQPPPLLGRRRALVPLRGQGGAHEPRARRGGARVQDLPLPLPLPLPQTRILTPTPTLTRCSSTRSTSTTSPTSTCSTPSRPPPTLAASAHSAPTRAPACWHAPAYRRGTSRSSSMVKVPPWQRLSSAPVPPRGGSGPARHPQKEAGPLRAQPRPLVLELAASKAAHFAAFDHSGGALRHHPHDHRARA